MPPKPAKLPEIFFDLRKGNYWVKIPQGRYLPLDGRKVKIHLMKAGMDVRVEDSIGLKTGDAVLYKAETERWVDFAGPIAGKKCGAVEIAGGRRVLVTSEHEKIIPKRGKFPRLEAFLDDLFAPDPAQLDYVLYWLKLAHQSLESGRFRPGHLLAMVGPPGCGKSFMHILITALLGGRSEKPYAFMTGETPFNAELAGAEHLIIEDEAAQSNFAARRKFGQQIKNWTTDEFLKVTTKGVTGITLSFFRRLSLSVNWEPENVQVLPPMDDSIKGRIMLFKCGAVDKNGDTIHPPLSEDRDKNTKMLNDELPALLHYLQRLKIPKHMEEPRYGVKAYHNKEILEVLSGLSAETRLAEFIDQIIFGGNDAPEFWRGSATELEKELAQSAFRFQVEKLLPNAVSCGTFLSRLAKQNPERYVKKLSEGRTVWLIIKGKK